MGERQSIRDRKNAFVRNLIRNGAAPEYAHKVGVEQAQRFDRKVNAGVIKVDHGVKKDTD